MTPYRDKIDFLLHARQGETFTDELDRTIETLTITRILKPTEKGVRAVLTDSHITRHNRDTREFTTTHDPNRRYEVRRLFDGTLYAQHTPTTTPEHHIHTGRFSSRALRHTHHHAAA